MFIVVLALIAIGDGLGRCCISHFYWQVPYILQSAATLACDVAITVSLLYNPGGHKNENLPDAH